MKKLRTCKKCGSEYVVWNWLKYPVSLNPFRGKLKLKFRKLFFYFGYLNECWNCGNTFRTYFKAKNIIDEETLHTFKPSNKTIFNELDETLSYVYNQREYITKNSKIYNFHKKRAHILINEFFSMIDFSKQSNIKI
jgi:hypothetical protein